VILVDTSVWVEHLRRGVPELAAALEREEVLAHPMVIGELACEMLRQRERILRDLANLPQAPRATDEEAMHFLERRGLMGRGVGFIDVHVLASVALMPGARLWTMDRRLEEIAFESGVSVAAI
jgi:predicted nucleic acid-binding protein